MVDSVTEARKRQIARLDGARPPTARKAMALAKSKAYQDGADAEATCGPTRPMSRTFMPGARSTASPPCRRRRKRSAPISPRRGRATRCRPVATRNDECSDAQSRPVSGAHYLRLKRASDARYLRLSARSLRRTRDHASRRTIIETKLPGAGQSAVPVRQENGRFPCGSERWVRINRKSPENPLRK